MRAHERLMTVDDAAKLLQTSKEALGALVDEGKLRAIRTLSGRRLFLRTQVVQVQAELQEADRRARWGEAR